MQIDFEFESCLVHFRNVRGNDRLRESVRIKSYMERSLLFTNFVYSHDFISASLRKGEQDGSYYLDVEVDGNRLPSGMNHIFSKIDFETNSVRNPKESISVLVTTYDDLFALPRMLYAEDLEFGKEYSASIILKRRGDAAYSLKDVHFTNNAVDIKKWTLEGDSIRIVYALNNSVRNDSITGHFQLNLVLEKPLVITIPFSGYIAEDTIAALNLRKRSALAKNIERKTAEWLSDMCQLDRSGTPRIAVDKESHDFDTVNMGKMPETTFIISNHGDGDLIIEKVHTSHDCIATRMEHLVIPPGKREALTVVLKTKNWNTCLKLRRTITISSNDPLNRKKKLEMKADIHMDFRLKNRFFTFQDAREGMILKDRIEVRSNMVEPLTFHDFKSDYDFIECIFSEGGEDKTYYLDMTADLRGIKL